MDASLHLSSAAILISIASFGWSIHIGNRDKGKLSVESELYNKNSNPFITIKAVNYGRRPIIITALWACYTDKTSFSNSMPEKRLNEHERFLENITQQDLYYFDNKGNEKEVIDYYLEDTIGRTYKIKNIQKHLKVVKGK
ncbi:hypothetical protein HQ584_07875 [Patescibacteria group bacterium]|nr:hypothetical protein [Patescibacteria group bacterium]